ncbi:Cysteine-rich secretory protein 3 [Mactra antiquata]
MTSGCYILMLYGVLGLVSSQGPFTQIQLANLLQQRNNLLQQSLLQNLRNVQQTTRGQMPLMDQLTSNVNRMTRNMFNSINVGTPTSVDAILRQQRNLQAQLLQGTQQSPNAMTNPSSSSIQTTDEVINTITTNQQPPIIVVTRQSNSNNNNNNNNNMGGRTQVIETTQGRSDPFSSSIGNTNTGFDEILATFGGISGINQPSNRTTFDPVTGITFGSGFTPPNRGSSGRTNTGVVVRDLTTEPVRKTLSCTAEFERMNGHTLCLTDSPDVTRSGLTVDDKLRITQTHNSLRSSVQPPAVDLMILQWDDRLAAVAQKWAKQCKLAHDDERSIPDLGMTIGQNVAVGFESWQAAIQMWYDEIALYRYGLDPDSYLGVDGWRQIAHFTQMVQNGTYLIGCGYAECPSSQYVRYYVCNYANGQSNLAHPYTAGPRCGMCPNNCNNGLCDCGGLVCLNGGTLDPNTCKCECPKLYMGESCEILNCPVNDNWICGRDWPPSHCDVYVNVPEQCPYMCGICGDKSALRPSSSSSSLTSSAATSAITMYTSAFGCRYRGIRDDAATCKSYGDNGADMRMCASEGGTVGCNQCERYYNIKKDYCPVMCGLCDPPCNGKRCSNGGTLDTNTCSCSCRKPFTGDACEFAQCPINGDPGYCVHWPKDYCTIYYNVPEECPYKCDICKPGNPEISVRGTPINWSRNRRSNLE